MKVPQGGMNIIVSSIQPTFKKFKRPVAVCVETKTTGLFSFSGPDLSRIKSC